MADYTPSRKRKRAGTPKSSPRSPYRGPSPRTPTMRMYQPMRPAMVRQGEVKTLDTQFTVTNVGTGYVPDTNPAMQLPGWNDPLGRQAVNLVQQGTAFSQRIGNKIKMKSVRIRMFLKTSTAPQLVVIPLRILLVYDRQTNGAYINNTLLLGQANQNGNLGVGSQTDNINPNFFDRFVVLMDKFIAAPPIAAGVLTSILTIGATESKTHIVDEFIRLKGLDTVFNTTANPCTIGCVNTGALILVCSGSVASAGNGYNLDGTVRLRFWDP